MCTARVVAWNELKIKNSFTVETSVFGFEEREGVNKHFSVTDLESIGRYLGLALSEFKLVN
jgi:hypothetical protein